MVTVAKINLRKKCLDSINNIEILKLLAILLHNIAYSLSIVVQLKYKQL